MRHGEYAETRRGQASRHTKRRHRRFYFEIDQPPQSKNIKPADALAFQLALLAELDRRKQRPYRGPVFLQFDFYNQAKSPPAIQSLPKNYLDLLETPRPDSNIARAHLLFNNDRQVKALTVRYNLVAPPYGEPKIRVRAEPLRDFYADLDLGRRIESNEFRDDDHRFSRRYDEGEFHDRLFGDERDPSEARFEALVQYVRDRASWVHLIGENAYESQLAFMRSQAQQEYLHFTDLFTCRELVWAYSTRPTASSAADLDRIFKVPRDQALAPPFALSLRHAPQKEGDTDLFKSELRTALETFKTRFPQIFPLTSLLNVTILMVPPEAGGKDLDNLARLVLPAVHDILQPPSDLSRTIDLGSATDPIIRSWWEDRIEALPKAPKYSVTEYRAFQLPRFPNDPKEGMVRLAVGAGFMPIDFRGEIDDFLRKWQRADV